MNLEEIKEIGRKQRKNMNKRKICRKIKYEEKKNMNKDETRNTQRNLDEEQ